MLFDNLPASKPAARRLKNEPVFGVGWHAYIHWPRRVWEPVQPVPMTDAHGVQITNDLTDGQEVEILSWRPRAREGLVYQVRRLCDRSEWSVAAVYLRRRREPQPEATDGNGLQGVPVGARR